MKGTAPAVDELQGLERFVGLVKRISRIREIKQD
jgi:hypothetical protein